MAWYNVYRPRTFTETLGQALVKKVLQNTIKTVATPPPKVKHAYLFSGPRGTGKTSIARIFAKGLNCVTQDSLLAGEPCGACDVCLNGQIDIIELDAASNTGIDNVRELIEAANTPPFISRYKVYIIDEIHMLSKPAMNALLKTLEEPPAYIIFLMATTDPEKILPTVISRVTHLRLTNHSIADILIQLSLISQREQLDISEPAMTMIARQAQGGLRDAVNLLETVSNYNLDKYQESDVAEILGVLPIPELAELTAVLESGSTADLKSQIEHFEKAGVDPEVLLAQLLDYCVTLSLEQLGTAARDAFLHYCLIQAVDEVLTSHYNLSSMQTSLSLVRIKLPPGNGQANQVDSPAPIINDSGPNPKKPTVLPTPVVESNVSNLAGGNTSAMFAEATMVTYISDMDSSMVKESRESYFPIDVTEEVITADSVFRPSNFVALIHANLDLKQGPIILKTFWDNLIAYENADTVLIHLLNKTFLAPLKSARTVSWLKNLTKDCYGQERRVIIETDVEHYRLEAAALNINIKVSAPINIQAPNHQPSPSPDSSRTNVELPQGSDITHVNLEINSNIALQSTQAMPSTSTIDDSSGFQISDFYFLYSPLPSGIVPAGMRLYPYLENKPPIAVSSANSGLAASHATEVEDQKNDQNPQLPDTSSQIQINAVMPTPAEFAGWQLELDDIDLE